MEKGYTKEDMIKDLTVKAIYGTQYDRNTKAKDIKTTIYSKICDPTVDNSQDINN